MNLRDPFVLIPIDDDRLSKQERRQEHIKLVQWLRDQEIPFTWTALMRRGAFSEHWLAAPVEYLDKLRPLETVQRLGWIDVDVNGFACSFRDTDVEGFQLQPIGKLLTAGSEDLMKQFKQYFAVQNLPYHTTFYTFSRWEVE